jgi:hypothetical protein
MSKSIKLRYLYCKHYLSLYRRWWYVGLRNTPIAKKHTECLINAMNAIWDRMSAAQQLFISTRPDPPY